MAQIGLHVDEREPWFGELRSELLSFPAGKHDDQVDALGLVGQLLDSIVHGTHPPKPEKPKNASGYAPLNTTPKMDDWITY